MIMLWAILISSLSKTALCTAFDLKDIVFELEDIVYIAPSCMANTQGAQLKDSLFPGINTPHTARNGALPHYPYCRQENKKKMRHLFQSLHGKKKYLWCIRGGYGSAHLFEDLNKVPQPPSPKVIIGYSDATFLHLFFGQKWKWKTIHGAMPMEDTEGGKEIKNWKLIWEIMEKEKGTLQYTNLKPMNTYASTAKEICGPITGGCLTLLANSLGTGWQLDAQGKILMIEDVNVKDYEIDRNLNHLKQAGALRNVHAIIFGCFLPKEGGVHGEKALKNFAQENKMAIFSCNWFGHGSKNYPIPFGCPAKMYKDEKGCWTLKIQYDFSS